MIPEYNSLDQHYEKPVYGSSLSAHTAGIAPTVSMASVNNVASGELPVIGMEPRGYSEHQPIVHDQHSSGLHLHFKALLAATSGILVLIAIGSLAFNSINAKINSIATTDKGQISASTLANYKATALTDEIVKNNNLQAGSFESITGLGELTVGSIASGFGTIDTTNNITTTADINGANFFGSGANLTNLNGSNISTGTVANSRLTTSVTLQGNTFNGISQLVQTTTGGILPVLSGANLTNLNGTNISSGTVADARLSANVALLNGTGLQTFNSNNKFTGTLLLQSATNSTSAFQVQNAASVALFTADTSGMIITIAGTNSSYASLTLADTHFKSTQTTAPTIGTPANCGTSPSAVVTAGSTDNAGSFSITVGTGGLSTTCDTVLTFNKPYAVAPKSIIITSTQAVGGANVQWIATISASSITGFTIKEASIDLSGLNHVASDISSYYYWVIE